jgi:TrmH family RNA methyltransferase
VVAELAASDLSVELVVWSPGDVVDDSIVRLVEDLGGAGVEVREAPGRALAELADTVTPQGVLAVARIPTRDWHDLDLARILLLDAVQDPGNLGTLVRTAEAMAMGGVVCLAGTVDPWSAKAVRAAAGSSLRLPILTASWPDARQHLEADSVSLWAADPRGTPLRRGDPIPTRTALCLGNEGSGVSEPVLDAASRRIALPLAGRVESLNVSVAGAVLMDRMFGEPGAAG